MHTNTKTVTRPLLSFLAFFMMGAVLYSCAPATQVTSSWKSPEATAKTYNNVVVAAMTDNVQARQVIEQKLQNQLQQRGIKATKSIDLFPPTAANRQGDDPDMMLERIQGDGYDGILTVALLDEETETRYVPGTAGYAPTTRFGWYGSFRGYYTYYRPTLYQPGYYTENKVYFLESNLYDAASENLVWSAQSKSYDPATLESFSGNFAETTVQQLAKDKVI